ncbi:MAG: hypothetical protein KDA24_13445 [Deltaproteobacteria bacterium]|nr:hypothetical protein [Deltaproteobacteria bacterium]
MNGLPLHPAIVHFPIAFAVLIPFLGAAFLLWTRENDSLAQQLLRVPAVLQVVTAIVAFIAQRTGDEDHHQVEDFVDRALIHEHEEAGELFFIGSIVTAVFWFASAVAKKPDMARKAAITAVVVGLVAAGLGLRAGEMGGELVFIHGGAEAWKP